MRQLCMYERPLFLFFQIGMMETFTVPLPETYETHCTDKPANNSEMCRGHVYPFYQRSSDTIFPSWNQSDAWLLCICRYPLLIWSQSDPSVFKNNCITYWTAVFYPCMAVMLWMCLEVTQVACCLWHLATWAVTTWRWHDPISVSSE